MSTTRGEKMAMVAAVGAGLASRARKAKEAMGPGWTAPLTAAYVAVQAWMLDKLDATSPAVDGVLTANAITFPVAVTGGVLMDMIPEGHGFIEKATQTVVLAGSMALGTVAAAELSQGDGSILNGLSVDMGSVPVGDVVAMAAPQAPAALAGVLIGDAAHPKQSRPAQ